MKALKIKTIVFTRASNGNFANIFGEIIHALISNQSTFNNLSYTHQELLERQRQIAKKTAISTEGSKTQKNDRDLERLACEQILFRLQGAVLNRANQAETYEERVTIVNLSKFTPYKKRERVGPITPPVPKAKIAKSLGTIELKWKTNKNVSSWIIQHVAGTNVSPSANWRTIAVVGRSKYIATGLPSGHHSFRLIAVSAVGESSPSQAATELAR